MRIITEPDVKIIGHTMHLPHDIYKLPAHANDLQNVVAMGGKVCYDSYGEDGRSVEKHVSSLVGSRHMSVLEHATVSLLLAGISRGCSHEIVRHRHFSYSQRSTRYTDENEAAIVLEPFLASLYVRDQDDPVDGLTTLESALLSDIIITAKRDFGTYRNTVARLEELNPEQLAGTSLRKWARGKARQSLPHSLETRMVITGNLRAWRHFLLMRSNRAAEPEIRRLTHAIWLRLDPLAPEAFGDLRVRLYGEYVELTTDSTEIE